MIKRPYKNIANGTPQERKPSRKEIEFIEAYFIQCPRLANERNKPMTTDDETKVKK